MYTAEKLNTSFGCKGSELIIICTDLGIGIMVYISELADGSIIVM